MKIIGITGFARAGKDTYARQLQKKYQQESPLWNTQIYSLSDALKVEMSRRVYMRFGVSSFTEDEHDKATIRPLLVKAAMARRREDENYWIKKLTKQINNDHPDVAIITDIRFENEARWVKRFGGKIVRVRRADIVAANKTEAENDKLIDPFVDEWIENQ